jgi:hypothetical protein
MSGLPELAMLATATLVYLIIDTYPVVKSFRDILATGSFWLLLVLFTVLNVVAFGALSITAGPKTVEWVGPHASTVALVMLSTLGTVGILQSLTLKIADYKFVDLGKLVDGLRGRVLEDIARHSADRQRMRAMKVADRLHDLFGSNILVLRDEFASTMAFGGQTAAQVIDELNKLEAESAASNLSFSKMLSRRIAQTDLPRAERLCDSFQVASATSVAKLPSSQSGS